MCSTEYKLDISNSYPRFLIFSSEMGFTTYISMPNLNHKVNDDLEFFFENIEVHILEDIWYNSIIKKNPNSIVLDSLTKVDLDDLSSVLTINLKKAKLIIRNAKGVYSEIDKDGVLHFNTQDFNFNKGDKKIWLNGHSSEFEKTKVTIQVVFSGGLDFIFNEADISIKSINFVELIDFYEIERIDMLKELEVKMKNRNFNDLLLNNIKSNFFDFDFCSKYFLGDENADVAVKDYCTDS